MVGSVFPYSLRSPSKLEKACRNLRDGCQAIRDVCELEAASGIQVTSPQLGPSILYRSPGIKVRIGSWGKLCWTYIRVLRENVGNYPGFSALYSTLEPNVLVRSRNHQRKQGHFRCRQECFSTPLG